MSDEETDMTYNDAAEMFSEMVIGTAEEEGVIDSSTAEDFHNALSSDRDPEDVEKAAERITDALFSESSREGDDQE